ncbi:MAG: hypothetical protein CMN30_30660 [Sandaracinus sp.]|nr:hypothetical protein [Sandaracinus sp.]
MPDALLADVETRLILLGEVGWPADVGGPTAAATISDAVAEFGLRPTGELRALWERYGYLHRTGFSVPGFFPIGVEDDEMSAGSLGAVHRRVGGALPRGAVVVGLDGEDWQVPERAHPYILLGRTVFGFDLRSGVVSFEVGSLREFLMEEVLSLPD